jgi:predicted secreted protein
MSSYGPPPPPPYGAAPGQPPMGTPPPNYLVWSILTTIFCCLPLGIVSIVFAAQVNGKWAMGDVAGAEDSSRKARQFAIWSVVAAAIIGVLYIVFFVILGLTGAFTRSNS